MTIQISEDQAKIFEKNGITVEDLQYTVSELKKRGESESEIQKKINTKYEALNGAVITPELKDKQGKTVTEASTDYATQKGEVKKRGVIHPVDFVKSLGKGFLRGTGSLGISLGKRYGNDIRKAMGKKPLTDYEIENMYAGKMFGKKGLGLGLPEQGGAYKAGSLIGEVAPYFLLPETKVAGLGKWGNRLLTYGYQGGIGGLLPSIAENGLNLKQNAKDTAIGAGTSIVLGGAFAKAGDKIARGARARRIAERRKIPLADRMSERQLNNATTPESQYGVANINSARNKQIAQQMENNIKAEQDLLREYKMVHSDMVKKYGSIENLKKVATEEFKRTSQTGEISEAVNDYRNLLEYEKTLGEAKYVKNNIKPSSTRESNFSYDNAPKTKQKTPKNGKSEPINEPTAQQKEPINEQAQTEIPQTETAGNEPPIGNEPPTGDVPNGEPANQTSKFVDTVNNSSLANDSIKGKAVATYRPISNKETLATAQKIIDNDMDGAIKRVLHTDKADAVDIAMAEDLMRRLQATGNDKDAETAIDILEQTASNLTKAGRTVQAARIWQALTPQGALLAYQKALNKANPPHVQAVIDNASEIFDRLKNAKTSKEAEKILQEELKNFSSRPKNRIIKELKSAYKNGTLDADALKDAVKKEFKIEKMPPEKEAQIQQLAKNIQEAKTPRDREVATALLKREIEEVKPASLGRKVSTLQAAAQLLNPKTIERNLIGNGLYGATEDVTQSLLATPIDKIMSLVTGERTIVPTNIGTQLKGLGRGSKLAWQDIRNGIDTSSNAGKYDLWGGRTFRNGGIGSALENAMNLVLRLPDRAAYTAVYDEAVENMLRASGAKNVTREMIENAPQAIKDQANLEALQRTFQDDSGLAKFGQGLKNGLNLGKDFGFGDLILKYAKTPSNILDRGINYSPIGLGKGVFETVAPILKKDIPFNQRVASMDLARGIMGTGIMGGGYGLTQLLPDTQGEREEKNRLRQNLMAQGNRPYSIPFGDKSYSYDWAVPISIPFSAGVNLRNKNGQGFVESILSSMNTLTEQPLLQGLQTLAGGGLQNMPEGAINTGVGIVNSFYPSLFRQTAQAVDPYYRDTKDSTKGLGGKVKTQFNRLLSNIPVASEKLPIKYDVTGQPVSRGATVGERIFNSFFNPANVSNRPNNYALNKSMNLYNQTGDSKALYPVVPNEVTIDGEKKILTKEQRSEYQKELGQMTQDVRNNMINDTDFSNLSPDEQVEVMDKHNKAINNAIKFYMFNAQPKTNKSLTQEIIDGYFDNVGYRNR